MGRKKLDRVPRLIKLLPEAWDKALRLAAAGDKYPSYAIERLLMAAPEPMGGSDDQPVDVEREAAPGDSEA